MSHKTVITVFLVAICMAFSIHAVNAQNLTADQEAKLRAELEKVEAEQKAAEKELNSAKAESASISKDISVLDAKIKVAKLNIKAKNLLIESLGKDINKKVEYIGKLEDRIDRGRETLASIMRKTNEIGSYTLPELLLSQDTITGLLQDIDNFESVQQGLYDTFSQIRDDKSETETEKSALEKRRNTETDAKYAIQQEQKNIEADEKEKQKLLAISKGNEASYSTLLTQKKARAAEIRATLFSLRDSSAIPFELALKYANEAYGATGIRPAFLLAIFAQESSLGADATFGRQVGSCYLSDPSTGEGASVKSGNVFPNVMKPGRDVEPFLQITKSLGLDYKKTLVSCPIASAGGWGGAMGPAQFIPSTWILYVNRIKSALGISLPNPWNPEHAFVAASLLLIDNGAKYNSYTAEKNAACKYYSGRACVAGSVNNTYGNQVMAKADMIQRTMIDPLQGF